MALNFNTFLVPLSGNLAFQVGSAYRSFRIQKTFLKSCCISLIRRNFPVPEYTTRGHTRELTLCRTSGFKWCEQRARWHARRTLFCKLWDHRLYVKPLNEACCDTAVFLSFWGETDDEKRLQYFYMFPHKISSAERHDVTLCFLATHADIPILPPYCRNRSCAYCTLHVRSANFWAHNQCSKWMQHIMWTRS